MLTTMSDDDLMVRLQEGDEAAFENLVARYRRKLVKFFSRKNFEWQLSEDLAQETFLRVYTCCQSYKSGGQFKAWIYRIARNLIIDTARRRGRDPHTAALMDTDDESILDRLSGFLAGPDDEAQCRELISIVDDILRTIPDSQRTAFELNVYAGLSLPEVADATGVCLATAKGRIRLARERIRAALEIRCDPHRDILRSHDREELLCY